MMATQIAQAIDDKLAWVRERAARAALNVSISTSAKAVDVAAFAPLPPLPLPVKPIPVDVPEVPTDRHSAKHDTKDASYLALSQLGLMGIKTSADDVFLIIAGACKAGALDVTGREIQALYERRFERRIESGTISARVNELIAAGRIFRRHEPRICTRTQKMAHPVYVVMKQVRMVF